MKIVHIITTLGDGGAENTLSKICEHDKQNKHIIISLKDGGKYYKILKKLGIQIYILNIKLYSFYKIFYIVKILNSLKPHVVQTWLVHGDFIGGLMARLAGIDSIVWNIRHSNLQFKKTKILTILIQKILIRFSFFIPKKIIVNSLKAKKIYQQSGYDKKKLIFIPNGYNLNIFKPNKLKYINFRKKYQPKKNIILIGNVARYDPKKDHSNLLNALKIIKSKKINFLCLLFGFKINKFNSKLVTEIKQLKLSNHVKLLGQSDDIPSIMNGLDIYIQSSSFGEGFPNVVAEAMACATPCVVTDVGDASQIVQEFGWVVPPNDPIKLANSIEQAINEIYSKKWHRRCINARKIIKNNFDIKKMIQAYNKIWFEINSNSA